MPGKNVALRREVIDLLDREKARGESYSDVVMRLSAPRRSLTELADFLESMPPVDDEDLPRRTDAIRRQGRKAWRGRGRR